VGVQPPVEQPVLLSQAPPPADPRVFTLPAGVEVFARRGSGQVSVVFNLPPVAPGAPVPGLAGGGHWWRALLNLLAGLTRSGGEVRLAKWLGHLPSYVTARDVQFAGAAWQRWVGSGAGGQAMPDEHWSVAQRGHFIMGASALSQAWSSGKISELQWRQGMAALLQQVQRMAAAPGPAPGGASADLARLDRLLKGFPELQLALGRNPRTWMALQAHPRAAALVLQTVQDMHTLRARGQPLDPPGNARPHSTLVLRAIHLSQRVAREVEGRGDLGGQPGFLPQWSNDGPRTEQYLDELYRQAQEAQPGFVQLVTELARSTGAQAQLREEPKDRARLRDKLSKYKGDASRLTDLVAGRLVFETVDALYQALERLHASAQVSLIRFEDRIITPQYSGYRDVTTLLRLPNGHVAELRLELRALTEYAAQVEHPLYEVVRDIEAQAKALGRPLNAAEKYLVQTLRQHAQYGYHRAFLDSVKWAR